MTSTGNEPTADDTDTTWKEVEHLLKDLKADGYEPTLLETVTSAPAPKKMIQINVERDAEAGGKK